MATQIVINARNKTASASFNAQCDRTIIFVLDLVGDTWHDFVYFAAKAQEHESQANFTMRNRYLRSAISNLFSHLDAIVSDIYELIEQHETHFANLPANQLSLKSKMFFIRDHVKSTKLASLPYVNVDLKLLRDIINHPSITKSRYDKSTQETIYYDSADIYTVDISELKTISLQIDAWLAKVCELYQYVRFCDTSQLCIQFSEQLGAKDLDIKTF